MSSIRGKFLVGSLIAAIALGVALDANAKRIGGSRSIGKQSSTVTQQRQQAPTQQSPSQQPAQQPAQQAAPATAGAAGAAAAATPKRNWVASWAASPLAWVLLRCCRTLAWPVQLRASCPT